MKVIIYRNDKPIRSHNEHKSLRYITKTKQLVIREDGEITDTFTVKSRELSWLECENTGEEEIFVRFDVE